MPIKTWDELTDGERETVIARLRHSWDAGINNSGSEKLHDAILKHAELEKRVAALEHYVRVLEGTLHNFMGRFANKA